MKKITLVLLFLSVLIALSLVSGVYAIEFKITASDGAEDDHFGNSVAISGDYALIGAVDDDDNGPRSGSAYIFKRAGTSWIQQAKLTTSDGMRYDYFGISVANAGNYALIGATGDDDRGSESGSAYIFKRNGTSWIQQAKLTALYGYAGDYFGDSVAIAGDYALVGASGKKGSAYIYDGVENNPPKTPTSPYPGNHATDQSINVDLSWTGGDPDADDTVTYDVHFSDWLSSYGYPPLVSYDQLGTTFKPGTLSYNTTYYWKIVATDNHGESTSGPTWDFTTGSKK